MVEKVIKTYVCARSQEEESNKNQEDVKDSTEPSTNATDHVETGSVVLGPHAKIGCTPEDETKEGIKQGTHNGQQVREEGDDLGNDPSSDPESRKDGSPRSPTNHSVVALVAATFKQTEEDESS